MIKKKHKTDKNGSIEHVYNFNQITLLHNHKLKFQNRHWRLICLILIILVFYNVRGVGCELASINPGLPPGVNPELIKHSVNLAQQSRRRSQSKVPRNKLNKSFQNSTTGSSNDDSDSDGSGDDSDVELPFRTDSEVYTRKKLSKDKRNRRFTDLETHKRRPINPLTKYPSDDQSEENKPTDKTPLLDTPLKEKPKVVKPVPINPNDKNKPKLSEATPILTKTKDKDEKIGPFSERLLRPISDNVDFNNLPFNTNTNTNTTETNSNDSTTKTNTADSTTNTTSPNPLNPNTGNNGVKKMTPPNSPTMTAESGSGSSDDFDVNEVEAVKKSKLDPSITQGLGNSIPRKSQVSGTQIPVATSFEYNRSAHVLEPKFEKPKVMGGIIQTLTDKESKLRRMTKRKLRIQHDLTLYISKESANVVNMLNNGEVGKLQKVHPLVYLRLQEVFQSQYALNQLLKKDGDKVKRYDKNWYLNSTPTAKASFIEEIRKYTKEPELYGKFKQPKKMKESRKLVYEKLELFHNDYICQRIVRENQFSDKIIRSFEQQSGLYIAPNYHNLVPGLGNLWLIKNFERYYMEASRSKVTTFSKVAPSLVGKFMLMVENGTVLPSPPSSQVAIHSLSIILSMVMEGVREPQLFLGKKKFYGFMSLCDTKCIQTLYDNDKVATTEKGVGKKGTVGKRLAQFLKWVQLFHTEDLLLIDTYAQRVLLSIMYAITREDFYRSSPRNVQLRIQSQFTNQKPSQSFLQEDSDDIVEPSMLEVGPDARERELREANRRLIEDYNRRRQEEYEKRRREQYKDPHKQYKNRQEYLRDQMGRVLDEQSKEVHKQKAEREKQAFEDALNGSDTFQKAMRQREEILRRARYNSRMPSNDVENEKSLFTNTADNTNDNADNTSEEKNTDVRSKLEGMGNTYKKFYNMFMSGYHEPGKSVNPENTSEQIIPFHVFATSNGGRVSGSVGYDHQFLDVINVITDLTNLANKDYNVYYQSVNTIIMIRSIHLALHSFENSKQKKITSSKTFGSLFRYLNTDSNGYVMNLTKQFLPATSLSLQLIFFIQELVERYHHGIIGLLRKFFKNLLFRGIIRAPTNFRQVNNNFNTYVIYDDKKYKGTLETVHQLVKMFKDSFITKASIPIPIIQYITIFLSLWSQSDSQTFNISDRSENIARKMFLLSFLVNKRSLADMATEMVLQHCAGLKMLHLGCVSKLNNNNKECKDYSLLLKKKKVLRIMRMIESTSMDPLDVIRIASDTCRRCVANLTVRPHVGAPTLLQMEQDLDDGEDDDLEDVEDSYLELDEGLEGGSGGCLDCLGCCNRKKNQETTSTSNSNSNPNSNSGGKDSSTDKDLSTNSASGQSTSTSRSGFGKSGIPCAAGSGTRAFGNPSYLQIPNNSSNTSSNILKTSLLQLDESLELKNNIFSSYSPASSGLRAFNSPSLTKPANINNNNGTIRNGDRQSKNRQADESKPTKPLTDSSSKSSLLELNDDVNSEKVNAETGESQSTKSKSNSNSDSENSNKKWYDPLKKVKNVFKKKMTPEEEAMMLPHFVDRLMLHSEITHRIHCYYTQKTLVKRLIKELKKAKDELDIKQIIANVFGEFRSIEIIQSGMASSIHQLICPFMMESPNELRLPIQTNILQYVIKQLVSKYKLNPIKKDLFKQFRGKINELVPDLEGYMKVDVVGSVFVGLRKYNGIYYSGGYAPFDKIDKPTNILLKPGEGRLVYDGDNFVPELTALNDIPSLESINIIHEYDYDRIVYQINTGNGEGASIVMSERKFALEYPNFIIRAHVLITAKALMRMGFDMGRVIWCGDKYGWVADFSLDNIVPVSDVPVYNGQYWLLTSQLTVKDVVGNVPIRLVDKKSYMDTGSTDITIDDKGLNEINVEIISNGKKVGEVKSHKGETLEGEDEEGMEFLVGAGGDNLSATPGAVKTVKTATYNPTTHGLTLDLDMPDFINM
ncbi:putative integral membrane protein [Theileria parva strain Muguga]|uniref:Uncharacterized protein n=1 Tax=Theileria parva TaxID=5875 RepID=Q4N6K9_THEPA|nr:putative integral membrane protein [Theileria parva strain Muguga]EAN34399.1 putative integral membrane protein [Theileria parva strain Muguga]|eukprot:XP_766682.1 hypothetical protein [Theileria parva strain Muguga]